MHILPLQAVFRLGLTLVKPMANSDDAETIQVIGDI